MIPKLGRRGFANCMVSRPSLDWVLNRLCSLEPADGQVGDNFRCTTFKKIKAGEVVKIELPLSRLGRVTQFVGFALVMSLALLALAAATQMLAWNWRYIAVQVFTGWQKLAAFQREQKWPQNFCQGRICYFCDKGVVF